MRRGTMFEFSFRVEERLFNIDHLLLSHVGCALQALGAAAFRRGISALPATIQSEQF
jgi:hypothetical protein